MYTYISQSRGWASGEGAAHALRVGVALRPRGLCLYPLAVTGLPFTVGAAVLAAWRRGGS